MSASIILSSDWSIVTACPVVLTDIMKPIHWEYSEAYSV